MKAAALHNISTYTLLQSPLKPTELLSAAKKRGYEAVALTDVNVTYGLFKFYEAAQQAGIKPILGMQIRVKGLLLDSAAYNLIVLAKNTTGLANLLKLSSTINLKTNNGEDLSKLSLSALQKYFTDLLFIIPADSSSELRKIHQQSPTLASEYLRELLKLIPDQSDLYLGVYAQKDQQYVKFVQSLSLQFKLELVACDSVEYLDAQDQFLRKVLLAIKDGQVIRQPLELAKQSGSHYLRSANELAQSCHELGIGQAFDNTYKIAEICNAQIEFRGPELPVYQQTKFASSEQYLLNLAQTGLQKRFNHQQVPAEYLQRLAYELKIIHEMGFDDYFLIVWDVINYAKSIGITTGPGRGSAAGSLVAYCLGITEVDPLEYNLLFERFLNPSRNEMPDIDLDIPDNRRDDVILYMYHKYGMDHAAQILTFGTLAAKQALRDCSKVFGFTAAQSGAIAKAVPFSKTKISLSQALSESKQLQAIVQASAENQLLFQTAQKLEGLPRHYSIHAAGLVISDQSIAARVGLQAGPLQIPVTQQTKTNVERLGLLKIDFLGLRNLTMLSDALKLIESTGFKLDPLTIPLNDTATMRLFAAGQTDGVFQFESEGIKRVLRRLSPDNFEDIVAVNALFRPGPMQNIDHFINRKKGKEAITYPDQALVDILRPTYGILVYQEQVMQTAQVLAGFSLSEADLLRRAISKKDAAIIEKEKQHFVSRAVSLGRSKKVAELVYSYIAQFANYGFNRSHAVAYSKIAFWLAYIKVHYPAAFYTALLNSVSANKAKVQEYIANAQEAGVKVLGPDINLSQTAYTIDDGHIRVGLSAIKGLRNDFIANISAIKKPLKDLNEFLLQIDAKFLTDKAVQPLIKAGCFDKLEPNRQKLLVNLPDLIDNAKYVGANQALALGLGGIRMKEAKELSASELISQEEEVLGFSVAPNPLIAVQKYAQRFGAKPINEFELNELGICVGKLVAIKPIRTKAGQEMAFITVADSSQTQSMTIFPQVYEQVKSFLTVGEIYLLKVKTQADRLNIDQIQFLVNKIKLVNFHEHQD